MILDAERKSIQKLMVSNYRATATIFSRYPDTLFGEFTKIHTAANPALSNRREMKRMTRSKQPPYSIGCGVKFS